MTHWGVLESDLARTYGYGPDGLRGLSLRTLVNRIGGLPSEARFARAWRATPREVTDPTEIARLTAAPSM